MHFSKSIVLPSQCSIDPKRIVELGEGPETLIFLHGLFGTPDHWIEVMKRLAGRYRVIAPQLPIDPAPDRRRHGMKQISDLREAVGEMIDNLEIENFALCGNSLGGLVAIDYCLAHPDSAKALVLAGSAGLFERSPIRGLRSRPTRQFVSDTIRGILFEDRLITDELIDQWHSSLLDRNYTRFVLRISRATRDRDVKDELAQLDLPSLIVWGRNDEITPPSTAEEFRRLIRGSQLEFIEQCGHAPNWERPDAFAEILGRFLPTYFS